MSVVIDEVIHEQLAGQMAEVNGVTQPAQGQSGPSNSVDLDRLAFEYRRRQHRLSRLWAD